MDASDIIAAVEVPPFENPEPRFLSDKLEDIVASQSEDSGSEYESDLVDDAQLQWEENVANLERTIYMILCPMIGRVIGRRIAQNLWLRFVAFRWNRRSVGL